MPDEVKKRGRPKKILTPEEIEAKRIAKISQANEYHRKTGYAAQKKYNAAHKDTYRGTAYEARARIPANKKDVFLKLVEVTGLSITDLLVGAVEEKYGVILHDDVDKSSGT